MEEAKFQKIVDDNMPKLVALMSPEHSVLGGKRIAYNAFFRGQEVAVVGYMLGDPDGANTVKPVAILVDEEVFDNLELDSESSRQDAQGKEQPPRLHTREQVPDV